MTRLSRIEEVEAIIRRKRRMAIKELEQLTYSSASTLRRDLIYLEEHGLIRRARGEVFLNSSNTNEESYFLRENKNKNAKKKIATLSRDFIGPGMCIYLDASTTVFELCPYVCEVNHLIILTNDLKSAQYLAEHTNPSNKFLRLEAKCVTILPPLSVRILNIPLFNILILILQSVRPVELMIDLCMKSL